MHLGEALHPAVALNDSTGAGVQRRLELGRVFEAMPADRLLDLWQVVKLRVISPRPRKRLGKVDVADAQCLVQGEPLLHLIQVSSPRGHPHSTQYVSTARPVSA